MKFTFDKTWLQKHAESDDRLEIAAGKLSIDRHYPGTGNSPETSSKDQPIEELVNRSKPSK